MVDSIYAILAKLVSAVRTVVYRRYRSDNASTYNLIRFIGAGICIIAKLIRCFFDEVALMMANGLFTEGHSFTLGTLIKCFVGPLIIMTVIEIALAIIFSSDDY